MEVIRCKNYEEASKVASDIFEKVISEKPNCVLGLATGSSPIGIYKNLIEAFQQQRISFKDVKSYNLDEYIGLGREHAQSYYTFMHENLFNYIDIAEENVHVPYAKDQSDIASCQAYTDELNKVQIDVQLLGIGANGHIGFNEPGTSFLQETFVVELKEKTREDNQRFFDSLDEVPTHAVTMGIKNIMQAKKIVLIATGDAKKEAVQKLLSKNVTTDFPASALHAHKDVVVIIDEASSKLL